MSCNYYYSPNIINLFAKIQAVSNLFLTQPYVIWNYILSKCQIVYSACENRVYTFKTDWGCKYAIFKA